MLRRLEKHGLFGQDDNVNLKKVVNDIRNHNGIVWMPIISLKREDADRLGYNNADAWRNLIRSKQFEIAEKHTIFRQRIWYGMEPSTKRKVIPLIYTIIVFNKNPGGEYISKKNYNQTKSYAHQNHFQRRAETNLW